MGFEGWLLKVNNEIFPTEFIALQSYKCTPDQIMDLDPYRDGDGYLHRNVLPYMVTSIVFTTTSLRLKDVNILNKFLSLKNRVECIVDYWNPNTSTYDTGTFYIADIPYGIYNVNEDKADILYDPIEVTFTAYGVLRPGVV